MSDGEPVPSSGGASPDEGSERSESSEDDASSLELDPEASERPIRVAGDAARAPCIPEGALKLDVSAGVWLFVEDADSALAREGIATRVPAAEGSLFGVQFEAYLSDGQLVDSSASIAAASASTVPGLERRADDVFRFRVGRSGVVAGFEEAVRRMRVGESAFVLVRSDQAFGAGGWRDVVPPFADLSYRVTVVEQSGPRRLVAEMSLAERLADAEGSYERGNAAFREDNFRQARLEYEAAADVLTTVRRSETSAASEEEGAEGVIARKEDLQSRVLSNIVATFERERDWEEVLRRADEALRAPRVLPKVRLRRARALAHVGEFVKCEAALQELERAGTALSAADADGVRAVRAEAALLEREAREKERTMYRRMASALGGRSRGAAGATGAAGAAKEDAPDHGSLYEDRIAQAEKKRADEEGAKTLLQRAVETIDAVYDATCGNLERAAENGLSWLCGACCNRPKRPRQPRAKDE
jgi:tetratricopeptide (TPR) repeat protein